ncbi:hypothetical protein DE146DRAFT_667104 [Phaeosphaeria sp. MPI-PUGE-AT-0046c]|nr:hypothetical protein DE146DRAFT_667104 [Phaeosphaeria sp. MPI-PUGE-AT-0046c]
MAQFFLLSGYYTSIAARKRTRTAFAVEKFKRLAVPTLVYSLCAKGVCWSIVAWRKHAGWEGVKTVFWENVRNTRGAGGPTWFTAVLLIFDAVYTMGWPEQFAPSPTPKPLKDKKPNGWSPSTPIPRRQTLKTSHVIIGLTLASASSFLIRLRYPFGHVFVPLNLMLGYLPQYVLYYSAGIWIQRRGVALDQPASARSLKIIGVAAFALGAVGVVKTREVLSQGGSIDDIVKLSGGGLNIFAFLYATLNETVGFLLGSLALYTFHHSSILSSRWTVWSRDVASGSYAAFLLHMPMLIETLTAFNEEAWKDNSPVVKTLVVGGLTAAKSWTLGLGMKWGLEWCGVKGYL